MAHAIYSEIADRLIKSALGALTLANTHAVYFDPGKEHWGESAALNAARAGELFIKAMVCEQHPLLIFTNAPSIAVEGGDKALSKIADSGISHNFKDLPNLLKNVCNVSIKDHDSFTEIGKIRNAVQHFFHPDAQVGIGGIARDKALNFLYKNVDPLIERHFDIFAINYIEDEFYDYIVNSLIGRELKFSIPPNFRISEVNIYDELESIPIKLGHILHGEGNLSIRCRIRH